MIEITKVVLGMSALASAGALMVVEPTLPVHLPEPIPAIMQTGKAVDRLPGAERPMSGGEIMQRIRLAHGLKDAQPSAQGVDCRAFTWPNIPDECISDTDGRARRAVRVISTDAPPTNSTAEQARRAARN